MDRLTAAKVFIDVAHSRSFTATASKLNMSRPMVTRYVEAMEDWLKIRLLNRTTRKISLTSAGQASLKEVENWLIQADKISALASADQALSGSVRIASSMSFGFTQLVPAVTEFMAAHPDVHIDIDLEDGVADLTEQGIDLAVRLASNPDSSLIGKPIGVCESVLVASPNYLKKKQPISHPQDLISNHDCLGYKNFERHIWHLSQKDEFEAIAVKCKLTANEATALLHASLHDAGISLQPTYLANPYINTGQLSHVLPNWKPSNLQIYVLYSSRKYLSPAVRQLIDFLEGYFSERRW